MNYKIREYRGQNIVVRYDVQRCIHAAECVTRLREVFDTSKRPWVAPDNAPAGEVAAVAARCPTGALHFERLDGGAQEAVPATNTITLVANGPIYVRGNVTVVGADGAVILRDTRVALCRCGASQEKPFCDNAHLSTTFLAPGMRREHEPAAAQDGQTAATLTITLDANGPYHLEGDVTIYGANRECIAQTNEAWLCRCGGSGDKPFCDSTHSTISFTG